MELFNGITERAITIHTAPGTDGALLVIKHDGRIERGPAFTTEDEASLKFWDIIETTFPIWKAKILADANHAGCFCPHCNPQT